MKNSSHLYNASYTVNITDNTLDSQFSSSCRSCFRHYHSVLDKGRERSATTLYFSQLTVNHGLEKSLFSNSSGILHAKVVELLNMMYYVFNSSL